MAMNKTVFGILSNIREYEYNPGAGSNRLKTADFSYSGVHRIRIQPVSIQFKKKFPPPPKKRGKFN